ncbi:uncharacterized protein LOC122386661 [Amphibalanus amphitrite]|uniref:uncharacterized protein LOC122386661 n=1 Tax=Amphibalanus amphitrite TaxID=1232801 RepID=UPI001C916772|nr:uncharacterized protein LOC122386661 [Amphibalanus amphitrite]
MRSPVGLRTLWLLGLPLLLPAPALTGSVGRRSPGPAVCEIAVCSVRPSCANARSVSCPSPGNETMTLHQDFFPTGVLSVNISGWSHVIIDEGAIKSLHSLVNFTISHAQRLDIESHGMASHSNNSLRLVRFENIASLHVKTGSFAGHWESQTAIQMHHIGHLDVESRAFDYHQAEEADDHRAEEGPSFLLQYVKMLNLESSWITGSVFEYVMNNVTMDVCHEESFGGRAFFSEWNNVTIGNISNKCFHSRNDMASFVIRNLLVKGDMHPYAFSGAVNELIIWDSYFDVVQSKSFNMTVCTMQVIGSRIRELQPEGLCVSVKEILRLETTRIDHIHKDALVRITVDESIKELDPLLTLDKLTIVKADAGSMSLSRCAKVRMIWLDMLYPWPRICPAYKWVQWLTEGGVDRQLGQYQYQLFLQLIRRRMCSGENLIRLPRLVEDPECASHSRAFSGAAPGRVG